MIFELIGVIINRNDERRNTYGKYNDFFVRFSPIQTIVNQIKNFNKRDGIDLQPTYQRGYIWGKEFIDKLWYSIIKGYPIGNISLRVLSKKNAKGAML